MLLRSLKVRKARKSLEQANKKLCLFSSETKENRELCREEIFLAKERSGKAWIDFLSEKPPHPDVYRLYLHTQHIAYLLEDVRQKQDELARLQGGSPPTSWTRDEEFSSSLVSQKSAEIFQLFIQENIAAFAALEESVSPP
ncbi:hypothetical protein KDX38_11070 [Pseudomonas sp. CDFA 602]|uniref:hypothetical protein n=1 Tax=Pseudomonas californiensis TaxID=2829823 RepID=UPI001E588704|nr:hypothetical protein [Pseudomonas californiensis]MCD5994141.1 hypothetical protein [Pseudomonas californiensis]MCD5999760.1 hypothetical protein [Pseudomonas californiensis]